MAYKILLHQNANKYLQQLNKETRERIIGGFSVLEKDPFNIQDKADIKKLHGIKGKEDLYRIRIGDYRAVYGVENHIVYVARIFHRGDGYDWLA